MVESQSQMDKIEEYHGEMQMATLEEAPILRRQDPFAKEDWYDIKARSIFDIKSIGKTLVSRTQGTKLIFADRGYERTTGKGLDDKERPNVNVVNWQDKDYSVVTIRCKDRPKLLFDTICTLSDMQCVVFHGNVDAE